MLKKLQLKLTMINLMLLSVVLLIIFSGIYFSMKNSMQKQSEMIIHSVAKDEQIKPPMGAPNNPPPNANYFFIKTDFKGKFIDISPNLNI